METELTLRVDNGFLAILEQDIKRKRDLGVAISTGDKFLIRVLEAFRDKTKTLSFMHKDNKLIVKRSASL